MIERSHSMTGNISGSGAKVVIVPVDSSRDFHSTCGGSCRPLAICFTLLTGFPRS